MSSSVDGLQAHLTYFHDSVQLKDIHTYGVQSDSGKLFLSGQPTKWKLDFGW